jgi:hypothetical protein
MPRYTQVQIYINHCSSCEQTENLIFMNSRTYSLATFTVPVCHRGNRGFYMEQVVILCLTCDHQLYCLHQVRGGSHSDLPPSSFDIWPYCVCVCVCARKGAFFSSGIFIRLRYLFLPSNFIPCLKKLFHDTVPNATPIRFFHNLQSTALSQLMKC